MGKWLAAGIVDIQTDENLVQRAIRVHFVGYKPKWDETIQLDAKGMGRIKEIGALSGAHGWARYNQAYQERILYEK